MKTKLKSITASPVHTNNTAVNSVLQQQQPVIKIHYEKVDKCTISNNDQKLDVHNILSAYLT